MSLMPCNTKDSTTVEYEHNDLIGRDLQDAHPIFSITSLQSELDKRLLLTGGTLTGNLTLNADPSTGLQAATKAYVDAIASGGTPDAFVLKDGDTMVGPLTLSQSPTQAYHAATKEYVDGNQSAGFVLKTGDTMTGALYLYASATEDLHSVPKQQAVIKDPLVDDDNLIQLTGNMVGMEIITDPNVFENVSEVFKITNGEMQEGDVTTNLLKLTADGILTMGSPVESVDGEPPTELVEGVIIKKNGSVQLMNDNTLEPAISIHSPILDGPPEQEVNLIEAFGWDGKEGFRVGRNGSMAVGGNAYLDEVGVTIGKNGSMAILAASEYVGLQIRQTVVQTLNLMETYDDGDVIGFQVTKNANVMVGDNPYNSKEGVVLTKDGSIAAYKGSSANSGDSVLSVLTDGFKNGWRVDHNGTAYCGSSWSDGFSTNTDGRTYIKLSSSGGNEAFRIRGWSGSNPDFLVTEKGNVIIGGNPYAGSTGTALTPTGSMMASGEIRAQYYTSTSDEREKKNIRSLGREEINKINKIKPKHFDWIINDEPEIGFIAQEVELYYPEAVHEDESGVLSINYNHLFSVAIGKIQELEERIMELEDK